MNLLEKFEAVTVQADQRISPSDKAFCEKHQAAYETAIQSFRELSFFWEDMVARQKELLGEADSGSDRYTEYLLSRNELEISTEKVNSHIEHLHKRFIQNIVGHFNSVYRVSASSGNICDNLLPKEPERRRWDNEEEYKEYHTQMQALIVRYQDIVDQIILFLDGRSFSQQAFYELAEKCHKAAWNLYQKKPDYERKKNVIRFTGYFCSTSSWSRYVEWELESKMKEILRGIAHFETGSYQVYPYGFSELLGYGRRSENEQAFSTCSKVTSLKMFKNGRVDVKFTTEDHAREFAESYLGSVA